MSDNKSVPVVSKYPSRRSLRDNPSTSRNNAIEIENPTRLSLREAAEAASQLGETILTPLAPLRFEAKESGARPLNSNVPKHEHVERSRGRKLVAATSATITACALVVSSVTSYIGMPGNNEHAAAALEPIQSLSLDDTTFDPGTAALDGIGVVEVAEVPLQGSNEPGTLDPASLKSSKVRYPFDQEVVLTDGFGYRTAPVEQFHDAQDMAAPHGTPIRAIASGVVIEAGFANDGCGFGLKLQHLVDGQTLTSRYCHMAESSHSYQIGDVINIGDPAGQVGNTGMSFGPHLHLALRLNGEPIDPMPYFAEKIEG